MIRLTSILNESIKLDGILDDYRGVTNWTDWYMNGGCYTFADALYQFVGKSAKFVSVGEVGTDVMAHICILYKGKYCDYNGCRSKNDILNDVSINGKAEWKIRNRNEVVAEHNYDRSEVVKIIKQMKSIQ